MNIKLLAVLQIGLSCLLIQNAKCQDRYDAIHSGIPWYDDRGEIVNAHSACIVKEGGRYYLFGEYKSDTANVFTGFSCYSSIDLMNWKFERIALARQVNGLLGPNRIGERVKVMKCPETGEFVMYMHTDDRKYNDPHIGYATSKTIDGEYQFQGALLYKGEPIKRWDMGTFQDTEGKGYLLIHHGYIYELSSDYKSAVRLVADHEKGGESPTIFKSNGVYFWLSSNLTSWERNDNMYMTATSLDGPWTMRGNFAPKGTLTWNSQCSFVLPIPQGQDTLFMYMGDRWSFPLQGSAATQVWLPLTVHGTELSIPEYWQSWNPKTVKPVDLSRSAKTIRNITPGFASNWKKTKQGQWISNMKGSVLKASFNGTQIAITGKTNPHGGYAMIRILDQNGQSVSNQIVDFYSKVEANDIRYVSPLLPKGKYDLEIEVMGINGVWYNKAGDHFGSDDHYITINDVLILNK